MDTITLNSRICASLLALFCGYSLTAATVTSGGGKLTVDVQEGENYTLSSSDVNALAGLDLC